MSTKKVVKPIKIISGKAKISAKKAAYRPTTSSKVASSFSGKAVLGFKKLPSGELLVPDSFETANVVSSNKLVAGIEASHDQIKKTLRNLTSVFVEDFEVAEIELAVSFSADGKFLGFGVGGAMSVKVKIRPMQDKN